MSKEFEDRLLDDAEFDEYLQRDSDVSQQYRELESRAVPPALDEKVLRQAQLHAESGKPTRRQWLRWGPPLAMAATALVTISVLYLPETFKAAAPVLTMPAPERVLERYDARAEVDTPVVPSAPAESESDLANAASADAQPPQSTAPVDNKREVRIAVPPPAPAPQARAPASVSQATSGNSSGLPFTSPIEEMSRSQAAPAEARKSAAAAEPPGVSPTVAPMPVPSQAPSTAIQTVTTVMPVSAERNLASRERSAEEQDAARREFAKALGRPEAAAASNDVVADAQATLELDRTITPQAWVNWIRELRAEGKGEQAAAFLKRLRAAHPEFQVPVDVR